MGKYFKKIIGLGIILSLTAGNFTGIALAADFDPNYLISDNELSDYNSMDLAEIQNFLEKTDGSLKNYICLDKEGNFKTASQTFYETSRKWLINPKYLLILVQKEMSLLTDKSPKQSQYDWATGYGCPDSGGCNPRWKGFYKQVNSAAAQTRYYLDHIGEFNYRPHLNYTIDDQEVIPENTATASLYNYTPHIHGNQLFWNLWNKYFSQKWPDGALLRAENSETVYLIENEKKRKIVSQSVFYSRFNPAKIVEVSRSDLKNYQNGPPVKYHNFSLLKNSKGEIYMIVNDQKRKIENQEVFRQLGFMEDELIKASNSELAEYRQGPEITEHTLYPAGALIQNEKTRAVYYVISGRKKLIINEEILNFNFQGLTIKKASPGELDRYRSAQPVKLPGGELIKTPDSNTVYVISEGKRLPIFNAKIFLDMNYSWDNIITVSKQTLEVHPLGQTITGQW